MGFTALRLLVSISIAVAGTMFLELIFLALDFDVPVLGVFDFMVMPILGTVMNFFWEYSQKRGVQPKGMVPIPWVYPAAVFLLSFLAVFITLSILLRVS